MISHTSKKSKLIFFAIGLGLLFWFIEAALMAYVFGDGEFLSQLLKPAAHEIWQRLLVFGFFLGFAFHADFLLTKHKRADDALRSSEEKYRSLVEHSLDAICIQDQDRIVFANPACAQLFGIETPTDLIGASLSDYFPVEFENHFTHQTTRKDESETGIRNIELVLPQLDGTHRIVELASIPLAYYGSTAKQFVFHDISERKQAEEKIKQRNKDCPFAEIKTTFSNYRSKWAVGY